ncbi:MAG TPA: rhodanese-like domain-containing protein, partial [Lacipirellulaceae bacterium]|nr:rhodanese-like domain-containing protein [Lacipirellulaceae bacterium]
MASDSLCAAFDVRERGEFNECQIPNTTSLPRSQIEFRIAQLAPNRSVPIVVYDEGGNRASLAARTLTEFGYERVLVLEGGLAAWRNEGRPTVSGVNVPSKAFGEKVHHERSIPEISAEELNELQRLSSDLMILDVRTPEEYRRFCIPGGVNVPGGDLLLWAEELKRKRNATIVVNCAGRTRSIIGTATLRRLGLTNVRALKNGTMGWVLAGLDLEKDPARTEPSAPPSSHAQAISLARQLAAEENIAWISPPQVSSALARMNEGVTYLIDVRSAREYESGHVPGSLNMPGGQAVQRADDFIAVRNAQIIFISNEAARAVMTAYWYRQMGFPNVSVLQGGLVAWSESGEMLATGALCNEPSGFEAAKRAAHYVDARSFARTLHAPVLILDVGTSLDFETTHVAGAKWISRGWVDVKLPELFPDRNQTIVLTCPDGQQSTLAAQTLTEIGYTHVSVLDGGVQAWS